MNVEQKAETLVQDIGISIPISPINVCQQISTHDFQVEYLEKRFKSSGFCGISIGDTCQAKIMINSSIEPKTRKLFTAAHEIAHVVLHIITGKKSESKCTSKDLNTNENNNKTSEYEANRFASALLMPSHLIQDDIKYNNLSWQLISNITNKCQTSLEATARRVVSLSKEHCVLLIQSNNTPWQPIKSPSWRPYLNKQLFPKHLDYCDYKSLTGTMEECDLSDWNINGFNSDEYSCKYSSINYQDKATDKIMTLLLLEERND